MLGTVRVARGYYHCRRCGHGHCPWDGVLGLDRADLTPAAREAVCLAGVQAGFAEAAAKTLRKLSGLRVAESTVLRATEGAGARLAEQVAAGETFGAATPWDWHVDAAGQTVAYVTADATGIPQQGPEGAAAEGKMAAVVAVYNPLPEEHARRRGSVRPPRMQARYLAAVGPLADLGEPLRRQAAQVGMDEAQRWIGISDGGAGMESFLEKNFGRLAAIILDFYHAAEHLHTLATAFCPGDEAVAKELGGRWCHQLKHEGGPAVLATLRELTVPRRAKEEYRQQVQYFANHGHRMDYPTYRRKGWQIGSGPVESACKRVVGQRLKGTGMRWGPTGSNAVCHLRALFLSDDHQWDAFWQRRPA